MYANHWTEVSAFSHTRSMAVSNSLPIYLKSSLDLGSITLKRTQRKLIQADKK